MRTHDGNIGAAKSARIHRVSWKDALATVFGAAWRLHHYRDVHTRMMREALCNLDCRARYDGCDDE